MATKIECGLHRNLIFAYIILAGGPSLYKTNVITTTVKNNNKCISLINARPRNESVFNVFCFLPHFFFKKSVTSQRGQVTVKCPTSRNLILIGN